MTATDLASAIGAPAAAIILTLWVLGQWVGNRKGKNPNSNRSVNGAILRSLTDIQLTLAKIEQRLEDLWDRQAK